MKRAATAAEKRWYQAVAELETCSLCRTYGVQVAHRNQGRGLGQKSDYWLTAAICPPEHHAIDNGKGMTQAERRAKWNAAFVDTPRRLFARGRLAWRGVGKFPLPDLYAMDLDAANAAFVDKFDRYIRAGELVLI